MTTATSVPITLASVTTGGPKLPPRILLYGTDGIGKSTFASQAEDPIFIPTEDGATRIDVPQFPLCETWEQVKECLRVLCKERHSHKTLILDSGDWTQALGVRFVTDRDFDGDPAKFDSYGRGYKVLMNEWIGLLSALDFTRKRLGMTVIIIAHAVVRTFNNPMGDNYDRYQSNLIDTPNTSIWAKTKEWADLVLFASRQVIVKKVDDKDKKGKGMLAKTKDGDRWLYAVGSAAWDAKVRAGWKLPDKLPLNYAAFNQYISGQVQADEPQEQEDAE